MRAPDQDSALMMMMVHFGHIMTLHQTVVCFVKTDENSRVRRP